ncbi:hypothetical protein F5Y09DRAFT_107316 [Xylaria sp. FL1042]|nr:hypothetical protein F5Y09DRAFT_107316 [Xylaria sp. FL1042]
MPAYGSGCKGSTTTSTTTTLTSSSSSTSRSSSSSTTRTTTTTTTKTTTTRTTTASPTSTSKPVSKDGTCGPKYGYTCIGSSYGSCCNGLTNRCGLLCLIGNCIPDYGTCLL